MVSLSMGAERNEDGRRSEDCVDILPSVNGGDSYSSQAHACTRVASVGSCHDALAAGEGCEQALKASPASLIFTAPTKSALAENSHSTQTNFACDLRFSADTCPHSGHLRLVFCGGTGTSRPPCHCVLYSSWRCNSNGLASKIARFNPDFCATFLVADLLMFLICRSSITTTTWFLLMWFETLCTKSFLMLATFVCNLAIQAFALRQFFENFFFLVMRRCSFPNFGRNFLSGWHWSTTWPLDSATKLTTPQSKPTADVDGCCGISTSRSV